MKSSFPLSWLTLCVLSALCPAQYSLAVVLQPFDPVNNDQQVGALQVNDGIAVNLTGNQQFVPGLTGGATTTVGTLQSQNRIVNDHGTIGALRLDTGAQNYAITIPDPITGGNTTFQVYDSNNLSDLPPVTASQSLTDIVDVQDNNYINTRVANVSNGSTLNVNIGQPGADTSASTNSWTMIAKQSSLFYVDGNSLTPTTLNWTSNNAISFNGSYGTPGAQLSFPVNNLVAYNGAFSVQTLDGAVSSFNVNSSADLRNYNNWLISQLQSGNLATSDYLTEFAKAATLRDSSIDYLISVDDPTDDVAQPIGDRIVINASGPNAVAHLAAGATLEVSGANGGVVRADNGALVTIDGKLSDEAYGGFEGSALYLTGASRGVNNGVINGNFLNEFNGTGVAVIGNGSNGVNVLNGSQFTNNGIVNFATTGDGTAAVNLGAGAIATNAGAINLGVADSSVSGSNNAVLVGADSARFINSAGATIYLGRGPQNALSDAPADTAQNLSGGINGILVNSAGTVINNGDIVLGSGVQNATGILVSGVMAPSVTNNGTITVNGDAAAIPLENIGLSVVNAGSGGGILNAGTINLNGVNGTGIKIVATANQSALATTTGTVNILGDSDPQSGTRNFGVWAEGDDGGLATANVSGQFMLAGTGAIGIHARNNATVNVAAATQINFSQGSDQIGVFAFGPQATVNIVGSHDFDAATTRATLFRIDSGAQFSSDGLSLTASGDGAKGIVGTGDGAQVTALNSQLTASGNGAYGMIVEGGATGSLDATSQIALTGANSTGGLADGQKHDLSGAASDAPVAGTVLTSAATLLSSAANAVGYAAVNLGQVVHNGVLMMSGASNTGIDIRQGGSAINTGTLQVTDGTGINLDGADSSLIRAGTVTVDNGVAGIRLSNGALLTLNDNDNAIVTNGTAHGILLDSGSGGLTLNGTTLNVLGSGNGIENGAETAAIVLNNATINVNDGSGIRSATALDPLATLQVNVAGAGNGFSFVRADGTPAAGDLTLGDGYVFNVNGQGGNGLLVNTLGNLNSTATITVNNSAGGSALLVSNAASVVNGGSLTSASLTAPVVDLTRLAAANFENRGTVAAASATSTAIASGNGNDTILLSSGAVVGDVNTGGGDDLVTWNGGSLNGSLSLGAGNANRALISSVDLAQTRHITSQTGTDNQLTFSGITARGGSFAMDDLSRGVNLGDGWNVINFTQGTQWELTGNLQLANSNVNIDDSSLLLAGNSVNPVISGGEPGSVIVTNAGTIDLTNGSGSPGNTLTINGDLVSQGGTIKLQTALNEGGALSNQFTDRVLINGNAASGVTLLDVTPTAASTGALTDANRNGVVDASEGISLVQVAGNASAGSFALKGGYVAAGPWRYDLYNFALGSSDASQRLVSGSGNNYWDYRLGNTYICQSDCTPVVEPTQPAGTTQPPIGSQPTGTPPVTAVPPQPGRLQTTPQVPSYISAPLGLAYYNAEIVDNLHRRLGELRHEQLYPDGDSPEMFLRYIGSNMTYKSNVSFNQYGYDFDMDYSAVQIGGNLLRLDGDKDSLRGGVAYTYGNSRIKPHAVDGASSTTFDNNALAMYLTWQRQNGFYLDGVLAFGNHRGSTDIPRQSDVGSLKAKSWTASLESGYPFVFDNGVRLEPQAQLMFTRVNMDNFTDKDQTTVNYQDYSQTIGRLGLRADKTWVDDKGRQYSPYLRANYYQGWGGGSKVTVGSQNVDMSHTFTGGKFGQMAELGAGGTITLKNQLSLYAEVDYRQQINGNGAKGWGYTGGVRWSF